MYGVYGVYGVFGVCKAMEAMESKRERKKKKILCGRNVIISERLKWLLLIITYLLSKVMLMMVALKHTNTDNHYFCCHCYQPRAHHFVRTEFDTSFHHHHHPSIGKKNVAISFSFLSSEKLSTKITPTFVNSESDFRKCNFLHPAILINFYFDCL